MTQDELLDLLNETLAPVGARPELGEEFESPPLTILRYYRRAARLHWLPLIGRAQSVVAVVRQPVDLGSGRGALDQLVERVRSAVHGAFPPSLRQGSTIGLTIVVATPEPLGPNDEAALQSVLATKRRGRVVTLGILRVNLGQEATAFAVSRVAADIFPEPIRVADMLVDHLRRFMPLLDLDGG